jgi:outer membrane protein TolC
VQKLPQINSFGKYDMLATIFAIPILFVMACKSFAKPLLSLFLIFLIYQSPIIHAQNELIDNETYGVYQIDLNQDIQAQLPPLQILLEAAASYHPAVKFNAEQAEAYKSRLDLEKKSWANHINGFFNYGYGNQTLIAQGSVNSDFVNIANGYRAGVNLNVPLYEFMSRKDRLNNRRHEYQAQLYKKEELMLEVHTLIVEEYHNLIFAYKIMQLRIEMVEKARQSMQISELEYKIGNVDIATYTRMIEIYTINSAAYENARKDFMMAYDKMEILLGVPLTSLIPNRQGGGQ